MVHNWYVNIREYPFSELEKFVLCYVVVIDFRDIHGPYSTDNVFNNL